MIESGLDLRLRKRNYTDQKLLVNFLWSIKSLNFHFIFNSARIRFNTLKI